MDFDPEVGVLIVHGIGTQKEGGELRQWVDAVLRYLDACPPSVDAGSEPRILQPSPGDKFVRLHTPPLGGTGAGDRQRWLIGEAWWADAFDVPDRKEVSRWMVGVSSWFIYLFVVRLWRRFHVDVWHIVTGLALALAVAGLFNRAASGGIGGAFWGAVVVTAAAVAVSVWRRGKRLGGVVVAATLLIGYPLAALITAGALLLWLVGLLPGKISEKARALQVGLAQSVGDVYALIASRRREQAMFDGISEAAKGLATAPGMAGKPLVLLAHSQGAALTYRALNTDDGLRAALADRNVTLITFGAAVVPVHVLEQRLRGAKPALRRLQGFAGLVGLLLFAFTLGRLAADGVDRVTHGAAIASLVLVVFAFVATWRQERRARPEPDTVTITQGPGSSLLQASDGPDVVRIGLRAPAGARLRWVDLWAPWDPVPNGPLCVSQPCSPSPCGPNSLPPPGAGNEFVSCRVANLHQPWRDHVVYRDNHEDVVSRWVGEIAVRARPEVDPANVERPGIQGGTAATGRTWRLTRGKYLLLGQVVALILGFMAIARLWDRLEDLGRRAARRIPLRSALSSLGDVMPEGARDGLFGQGRDAAHLHGLLVALALLLAAIFVGSKVVSAWQKAATGAYLAGRPDDELRASGWIPACVVAVIVVGALLTWAFSSIDPVPTRTVRVYPAVIADSSKAPVPSPSTTVRFEPLGTGDKTPVVVKMGDSPAEVTLDGGVEYRITAEATGGKDCAISAETTERPSQVRVRCEPEGAFLPKSAP